MDSQTIMLLIIVIFSGFLVLPPMLIFWMYWSDRKKSKFLYFSSENICKIVSSEIMDGKFTLKEGKKEKIFDINESKPIQLETWLGLKPLHFVKWDSVAPLKVSLKNNTLEDVKITPDALSQLKKSNLIEKLLNPKESNMNIFLFMIVGLVVGGIAGYAIAIIQAKPV